MKQIVPLSFGLPKAGGPVPLRVRRDMLARVADWQAQLSDRHFGGEVATRAGQHVPILICISLVRESAMQLLVTVCNSAIVGFDVIARMAFVQGAIEIMSRLRQRLCIAADTVTPAVIAPILDLRR
jgi:hypothetical protein